MIDTPSPSPKRATPFTWDFYAMPVVITNSSNFVWSFGFPYFLEGVHWKFEWSSGKALATVVKDPVLFSDKSEVDLLLKFKKLLRRFYGATPGPYGWIYTRHPLQSVARWIKETNGLAVAAGKSCTCLVKACVNSGADIDPNGVVVKDLLP